MTTRQLDLDILQADAPMLERIKAQDYRDSVQAANAREDARLAMQQAATTASMAIEHQKADAITAELSPANSEPPLTLRQRVVLCIADKYMTTSTSIDPLLVAKDASNDAARLRAAVDEVLKVMV